MTESDYLSQWLGYILSLQQGEKDQDYSEE